MHITPQISIAQNNDIPALCNLLQQLFAQEQEFTPDHEAQTRGLARIISNPQIGHILVARHNSEIVGMVNLLYTVSTALGESVALLEDMIIAPQARHIGTGSKLLQKAIRFAEEQGCRRITLLTDGDNIIAQDFYKKHGFKVSCMLPLQLMLGE